MPILSKGAFIYEPPGKGPAGKQVIRFQFNPESLSRNISRGFGNAGSGTSNQSGRGGSSGTGLAGAQSLNTASEMAESITLKAQFDAREGDYEDSKSATVDLAYDPVNNAVGLYPLLSALEDLVSPVASPQGKTASASTSPPNVIPLVFFWWSPNRILPVKINSLAINETEFNHELVPLRAEVNITMEVLTKTESLSDSAAQNRAQHAIDFMKERKRKAADAYYKKYSPAAKELEPYKEAIGES